MARVDDDIAEMICGVDREGSGASSMGPDLALARFTLASLQPKLKQASPSGSLCPRSAVNRR